MSKIFATAHMPVGSIKSNLWFNSLDILERMQIAEHYTDETSDNTNIVNGLTTESQKWLYKNYQSEINNYYNEN